MNSPGVSQPAIHAARSVAALTDGPISVPSRLQGAVSTSDHDAGTETASTPEPSTRSTHAAIGVVSVTCGAAVVSTTSVVAVGTGVTSVVVTSAGGAVARMTTPETMAPTPVRPSTMAMAMGSRDDDIRSVSRRLAPDVTRRACLVGSARRSVGSPPHLSPKADSAVSPPARSPIGSGDARSQPIG